MKKLVLAGVAIVSVVATASFAQQPIDTARQDAVIKAAFAAAPDEWKPRLDPDETMRQCTASGNSPAAAVAEEIQKREHARIQYPEDGKLMGDWHRGERIAQSGYGLRFTDYPPRNPNGGNCYACHQLTKAEVSFGTVGPSLREYGKLRKYGEADIKAVYEKIYDSHAAAPCSLMPRFGANRILTPEQIRDVVALLMDPESPVNK